MNAVLILLKTGLIPLKRANSALTNTLPMLRMKLTTPVPIIRRPLTNTLSAFVINLGTFIGLNLGSFIDLNKLIYG